MNGTLLENLGSINWSSLDAYGEASDVPGMLRALLSQSAAIRK